MNMDTDLSNLIFFASIACAVMGRVDWALYLAMAAIYVTLMENGFNPLDIHFHRKPEQ